MKGKSILVVEDDQYINKLLCKILNQEGYYTQSAYSGLEVFLQMKQDTFDMILLDLMLPAVSGEELLDQIRQIHSIPIVVISAKDEVKLKSQLLRLGADDYITKPFDNEEVLARIESIFRRCSVGNASNMCSEQLTYKDVIIDKVSKEVVVNNTRIILTAKEYQILELMLSYQSKVFSKANLFESVWGETYAYDDNTVNVHMSNIRSKLKKANSQEEYIETIWGLGYKLIQI
ncbi:MAG: response regulator transcription factor [Cellulosilyticaceae bacterium]